MGGVTTASLCLAAGSLLDADPFVLADAAAAAGFDGIGLRLSHDHALDAAGLRRLAAHIGHLGLTVHDVEVHRIGDDANGNGADIGPLVDAAAAVGARHLLVVSDLADNPSGREHTVHRLGTVADRCRAAGLVAGIEYMAWLADWYVANCRNPKNPTAPSVGFFQIGGGIAGDFPICVVPMLYQDMEMEDIPFWGYFCQISDSTTSYGSYSGAVPNEKITWGKLDIDTPKFIVESDATIVAPLMFAWILKW